VEQCGLEDYIGVTLGKLSKGFKQRVGLAQAIIHDPEVLILDEPTIGIDPIQVAQTRQLIRQLGQNRTILLSTHILPEISMICERVIIIHEGKIVARDSIENLSAILSSGNRIHLKIQGDAGKVTKQLRQIASIQSVTYESPIHIVEFTAGQEPQTEIMEAVMQNGWTLLAMESAEMDLEDIFIRLTTQKEAGS
jgi:ABC-2 type transport system ATP-binding protein